MKHASTDEIMAEVHAVKDALSREAGFDVVQLIAASRNRANPQPSRSMTGVVKRRSPRRVAHAKKSKLAV